MSAVRTVRRRLAELGLGLGLAALVPPGALAQGKLYKCGNTYSQTPCEVGAQAVRVHRDAMVAAPAGPRSKALCQQAVQDRLDPLDPQAALRVVEVVGPPGYEVVRIGEASVAARRYEVVVNLRPPQGSAVRLQTFQCVLSEDEARLLALRGR